jgi:hypothetical protein
MDARLKSFGYSVSPLAMQVKPFIIPSRFEPLHT